MTLVLNPVSEFSDADLVRLCREGQAEALDILLDRYRRFARAKARGYFLAGGDVDDIEQEGLIGLYKAVRDFRADRQVSFRAFAELCITRQIITAIKTATRQKHRPLNSYVSLYGVGTLDDAGERLVEGLLDQRAADPADEVVQEEGRAELTTLLARLLSGLEVDVLGLYVEGWSYQEIGEQLGRHVKSIDNALQRIKRKLEAHLEARDGDEEPTATASTVAAVA
ncbi:MAG: RNA polymerase sporulation sigma factor SigH [Actinomycetota bacterium]|nr:RNA polymerase sporulation sigma factor SigH [Actinomycetota bacterium]